MTWPGSLCIIDGCERGVRHASGMCQLHRKRVARNGDLAKPVRIVAYFDVKCSVTDCPKAARSVGLCKTHYATLRRNGDPTIRFVAPPGSGSDHGNGYRVRTVPTHPTANTNGKTYEHRMVLFDRIGPGEHACHWCGVLVTWDVRDVGDRRCLSADHLNSQPADNRPENLVPSCVPCNATRTNRLRSNFSPRKVLA